MFHSLPKTPPDGQAVDLMVKIDGGVGFNSALAGYSVCTATLYFLGIDGYAFNVRTSSPSGFF